ncbi:MAG: hypothetical protein KBT27_16145 [Prevotellaceae bacterium]|nr:hypothetical protein [Candidatus Faecinaster equi]
MKKFVSFIIAILFIFGLTGCSEPVAFNDEEAEAFEYFMTCVKDPSSVIIYGDITFVKLNDALAMHVTYNAKNGFGAYAGVTTVQVMVLKSGEKVICNEDDCYFVDLDYLRDDEMRTKFIEQNEGSYVHFIGGDWVSRTYNVDYKAYGSN